MLRDMTSTFSGKETSVKAPEVAKAFKVRLDIYLVFYHD